MSEIAMEFGNIHWESMESRPNKAIAGISRWLHGERVDGRFVGDVWGELRIKWHPSCNRVVGLAPVEVRFREGCDGNFNRTWRYEDGRMASATWTRRCEWCFDQLHSDPDVITFAVWDEKRNRDDSPDMNFTEFKEWYHARLASKSAT